MVDLTQFDWTALPLGTKVRGKWKLVARLYCCCGRHSATHLIALLKTGRSYRLLRRNSDGAWDEHNVHPLHAKYDQFHWIQEATAAWNNLAGHPIAVEMLPRPKGVRYQ